MWLVASTPCGGRTSSSCRLSSVSCVNRSSSGELLWSLLTREKDWTQVKCPCFRPCVWRAKCAFDQFYGIVLALWSFYWRKVSGNIFHIFYFEIRQVNQVFLVFERVLSSKRSYYVLLERWYFFPYSVQYHPQHFIHPLLSPRHLVELLDLLDYNFYSHYQSHWLCFDNLRINWMLITSHLFPILYCLCSVNRAMDANLSRVWTVDLLTGISHPGVRFAFPLFSWLKITFCRLLRCNWFRAG